MWDRFDVDAGVKTQTRPPTSPSQARQVKCHRNFARSSSQTVRVWKFFATIIWTRCVADPSQTREPGVVNVIITQVRSCSVADAPAPLPDDLAASRLNVTIIIFDGVPGIGFEQQFAHTHDALQHYARGSTDAA